MKKGIALAIAFITLLTATTTAIGQKIYRCGSEYSQVPCSDAVIVDAADPRSSAQKVQSDAMIQRNSAAARDLEKTRLKVEASFRAEPAAQRANSKKKKGKPSQDGTNATSASQSSATDANKDGKKTKKASKNKEDAYFTARSTPVPVKK